MNRHSDPQPSRILVIDDNRAIHADFRKILGAPPTSDDGFEAAQAAFFGETTTKVESGPAFAIDSAFQGSEGVQMLRAALEEGRPYAMAFLDVRMPPGIDGIETADLLWKRDPDLQIAICTAYSDYSWHEAIAKLGHNDRLLILKKPFDSVEVRQIAHALTEKWALSRALGLRLANLEVNVAERTHELTVANAQLRQQAALLDKAQDAIVVRDLDDKIEYWNASAERLYGWTATEAVGRKANELLYIDDSPYREARSMLMEKGDWIGELRQQTKAGQEVRIIAPR